MIHAWPSERLSVLLKEPATYGIVQPGSHDPDGTPIVRVSDFRAGRIMAERPLKVSPGVADRFRRTELTGGEVLVSLVGTVGECAVVPAAMAGWNVARAVGVLRPRSVSARWLSICISSPAVQRQLDEVLNTTVQATLNLKDLNGLNIPVPPENEQRAITEVLGALDDKITANENLCRTIDSLVTTLFAKMTERSAWGRLEQVAMVNDRVVRPSTGKLRYIDISSVGEGQYDYPDPMLWEDAPGRARRGVSAGDTIWSTVRPNRRSHALVLDEDDNLVASTGLAVLTPEKNRFAYFFEATRTPEFTTYLEGVAEGSAYPAVRAARFKDAPVPLPISAQVDHFEAMAAPLRMRAHAAEAESRALARTRDTLLPLLMSGKVRAKDVEKLVEEVV